MVEWCMHDELDRMWNEAGLRMQRKIQLNNPNSRPRFEPAYARLQRYCCSNQRGIFTLLAGRHSVIHYELWYIDKLTVAGNDSLRKNRSFPIDATGHAVCIVTCYLVTRQIIRGFWSLFSIYWIYSRRNLQLIITVSISLLQCVYNLVITLYSSAAIIHNSVSCLRASCRVTNSRLTAFTSRLELVVCRCIPIHLALLTLTGTGFILVI
jgi:hypothetical protein